MLSKRGTFSAKKQAKKRPQIRWMKNYFLDNEEKEK